MSQSSSPISFSSEDAGYDWEEGNKGSQRTSVQDLSSLFKTTQMLHPKHIQQATNAGSHTTVTCADEHEPIQLCPRLCPPASFLFAGHYGRCQSNWSFSSSPCPVCRGRCDQAFQAFSGCLCAQAERVLRSRSPCSRALTKLAASSEYKVSLQFPASRETQAPRTMDTCQTIAVIQGHFGSPNWRLLAPVLSALPSARSTGSRS